MLALYLDPGHYSFTVELGFPTLALAGFGFSFQCGLGAGIWNQAIVLSSWSFRTLALTGFSFQCGLEATVLSRCSLFRAFCGRLQLSMWAWSRYLEPGHCSFLVELGFRTLALAGFSFQCGLGAGFGTRPLFFHRVLCFVHSVAGFSFQCGLGPVFGTRPLFFHVEICFVHWHFQVWQLLATCWSLRPTEA